MRESALHTRVSSRITHPHLIMNKMYVALLGAFVIVGATALSGCQTETQTEVEANGDVDRDAEVGLTPDAEAALDNAGSSMEAGLDSVGAAVREGGQAVIDGADAVGDAVDSNVDLGENAENQ